MSACELLRKVVSEARVFALPRKSGEAVDGEADEGCSDDEKAGWDEE